MQHFPGNPTVPRPSGYQWLPIAPRWHPSCPKWFPNGSQWLQALPSAFQWAFPESLPCWMALSLSRRFCSKEAPAMTPKWLFPREPPHAGWPLAKLTPLLKGSACDDPKWASRREPPMLDGPSLNRHLCSKEAPVPSPCSQAHTHGGWLALNLEPAAKGEQPQRSWLPAARWNLGAFGG